MQTSDAALLIILQSNLNRLDSAVARIREELPEELKVLKGSGTIVDPHRQECPILNPVYDVLGELETQIHTIERHSFSQK